MGIEFRESSLTIGPKTNAVLRKGMIFNVCVGLSDLPNHSSTDKEGKVRIFLIVTLFVCIFNKNP